MANFSGKMNLLGFKGAKVYTGLDAERPQMAWVCVPVTFNDITLSQDGKRADVGFYMQETNEKFRQACIQRRQMSGDPMEGYNPPSHQMDASFSKDFRAKALEAARKRIVSEHPEWQANPDLQQPEFNNDLKKAMYDAVRIRLASVYAHVRQQQGYGQQSAYGQPQAQAFGGQAQTWQPPQTDPLTGQPVAQGGYDPADDDLPF